MARIIILFILFFSSLRVAAAADDDNQLELRLNPEIENDTQLVRDYSEYRFLNLSKNYIDLNGADWSCLRPMFRASADRKRQFSVIYLGDSHIQADFGGSVLRRRLQEASADGGRGLIIPFKMAGTNEPTDYAVAIDGEYMSSRLLKMPWPTEMTFTGISVKPLGPRNIFNIWVTDSIRYLSVLHRGGSPVVEEVVSMGDTIPFVCLSKGKGVLKIELERTVDTCAVRLRSGDDFTLGAFRTDRDSVGTFVHSIGNNGATYSSYCLIDHFADDLSTLSPDLIIIALGTNEAFSNITDEAMYDNIDMLVSMVRESNPEAQLLLVTPTECYRRTYSRRGKRRRRTSVLTVNSKALRMRNVIMKYGKNKGVPVYDMYAVAGGDGSAAGMKKAGVLSKDGVHFTAQGYVLWGDLLSDAILNQKLK